MRELHEFAAAAGVLAAWLRALNGRDLSVLLALASPSIHLVFAADTAAAAGREGLRGHAGVRALVQVFDHLLPGWRVRPGPFIDQDGDVLTQVAIAFDGGSVPERTLLARVRDGRLERVRAFVAPAVPGRAARAGRSRTANARSSACWPPATPRRRSRRSSCSPRRRCARTSRTRGCASGRARRSRPSPGHSRSGRSRPFRGHRKRDATGPRGAPWLILAGDTRSAARGPRRAPGAAPGDRPHARAERGLRLGASTKVEAVALALEQGEITAAPRPPRA